MQNKTQNQNENQSSKKEPFSLMTIKTLLAIFLFVGIGTIIIGGGYIVGEYYKNKTANQIAKPVEKAENYYDVLEKKCGNDSCCLSSLDLMRQGNYKEADKNGNCPDGFEMNMQKCESSFQWCELIEKKCIKEGYSMDGRLMIRNNMSCCGNLKQSLNYNVADNDNERCAPLLDIFTCINCPNGECGLGENKCNCPEDCGEENFNGSFGSSDKNNEIKLSDLVDKEVVEKIEDNIGYSVNFNVLEGDWNNCDKYGSDIIAPCLCQLQFTEREDDVYVLKLVFDTIKSEDESNALREFDIDYEQYNEYKLIDDDLFIKNIPLAKKYYSDSVGGLIRATKNNFTFSFSSFYEDEIDEDYLISVISDLGNKIDESSDNKTE